MIGTVFAMHVNARSSNHDPNHEVDRDPKRLSERDSFLCEHSQSSIEDQKGDISLFKVYGDSALLVLNYTSLNSVNALLVPS